MSQYDAALASLESSLAAIEAELPPVFAALPRAATLPPLDSAKLHRSLITSGLLQLTAFLRLSGAHTEKHALLVEEMGRLKALSLRLRTVAATARVEGEAAGAGEGAGGGAAGAPRGEHLSLDGAPGRRVDGAAAGRFVRAALEAPLPPPAAGKRPRSGGRGE
jgi:hypothetical protein